MTGHTNKQIYNNFIIERWLWIDVNDKIREFVKEYFI